MRRGASMRAVALNTLGYRLVFAFGIFIVFMYVVAYSAAYFLMIGLDLDDQNADRFRSIEFYRLALTMISIYPAFVWMLYFMYNKFVNLVFLFSFLVSVATLGGMLTFYGWYIVDLVRCSQVAHCVGDGKGPFGVDIDFFMFLFATGIQIVAIVVLVLIGFLIRGRVRMTNLINFFSDDTRALPRSMGYGGQVNAPLAATVAVQPIMSRFQRGPPNNDDSRAQDTQSALEQHEWRSDGPNDDADDYDETVPLSYRDLLLARGVSVLALVLSGFSRCENAIDRTFGCLPLWLAGDDHAYVGVDGRNPLSHLSRSFRGSDVANQAQSGLMPIGGEFSRNNRDASGDTEYDDDNNNFDPEEPFENLWWNLWMSPTAATGRLTRRAGMSKPYSSRGTRTHITPNIGLANTGSRRSVRRDGGNHL